MECDCRSFDTKNVFTRTHGSVHCAPTQKHTHTYRNIYKFVCKSENVFRKRTGNLINAVCVLAWGPKCRVAADTALTVPRELRSRLWSGNLVNLLRKRREEEHKWLARAKGKPLSLIIPSFFFPLFLFSHYTLSPRVHRNANVFISSTANQCAPDRMCECLSVYIYIYCANVNLVCL